MTRTTRGWSVQSALTRPAGVPRSYPPRPPRSDRHRLFRYDLRIVLAETSAALTGWSDRLIATVLLLVALGTVRSAATAGPWPRTAWAAFGLGALFGASLSRLIAARTLHHTTDGPLAADALEPSSRRRYGLSCLAAACALVAIVAAIGDPALVPTALAGCLAGASARHAAGPFVSRPGPGARRRRRLMGAFRPGGPLAGVAAAAVLLPASWLIAGRGGQELLLPTAGTVATALGLALTRVDPAVVRFMTLAGHGSGRVVARHARALAAMAGTAGSACLAAFGPPVAAVVLLSSAAVLLLLVLRVLALRVHGERYAGVLVSAVLALLVLTAISVPPALPLVAVVCVWRMLRRARERTWLLT